MIQEEVEKNNPVYFRANVYVPRSSASRKIPSAFSRHRRVASMMGWVSQQRSGFVDNVLISGLQQYYFVNILCF